MGTVDEKPLAQDTKVGLSEQDGGDNSIRAKDGSNCKQETLGLALVTWKAYL